MRRPTDQVGWSRGFRQFILKIHGRCDLACDHCYVYTMADQRWRHRPRAMSSNTMDQVAARIAEHVRAHRLGSVDVVLHGGEPLLAGPQRLAHCVRALRAAVGSDAEVRMRMQTNGLRLDADLLRLLDELRIRVGVSLDGDQVGHDRHRRRPDGTGSYPLVARALRALGGHRELFGGLLCTIDLRNDPVRTYESLLEFAPPAVDFLLPNGNWSSPPPGREPGSAATPYADWLIAVFDRWYRAAEQETHVRLFAEILNVLLGGKSTVEGIGLSPTAMVVVETDGAIEGSDMLTGTYQAAAATGLHVARDSFDAALRHPAFQAPSTALECRECQLHRVCGGGLHAHRYRAGSSGGGFANPSVYCADLYRLISHIRDSVARDLVPLQRKTSW
ncbi:FxsB family cyclophane-forming radical SAM/SPASM peptide maturase [Saccharopolyspora sp. 5N708]|uniref:FxsB family cyclophane-forming radical SAM/SPASM peptide maturase n=1 Tax=Saccharopolyspora sp. 5N708 TaxID=3457424 RepID=UPI003FD4EAA8